MITYIVCGKKIQLLIPEQILVLILQLILKKGDVNKGWVFQGGVF